MDEVNSKFHDFGAVINPSNKQLVFASTRNLPGVQYEGSQFDGVLPDLVAYERNRNEKWRFNTEGAVFSSPAVEGGVVYFGSEDNHLYAVDARSGLERWRFTPTGDLIVSPIMFSSPAIADGVVYFGSGDSHLYAVDASTGEEIWTFKTGGGIPSSPAVVGETVYFGSIDGHVYALDRKTGLEMWRFRSEGAVDSSPAVADGVVYFGSFDGYLYAIH